MRTDLIGSFVLRSISFYLVVFLLCRDQAKSSKRKAELVGNSESRRAPDGCGEVETLCVLYLLVTLSNYVILSLIPNKT